MSLYIFNPLKKRKTNPVEIVETVSCLAKGIAVSINNGEWSLVKDENQDYIISNLGQGEVAINFNQNGSFKTNSINLYSFYLVPRGGFNDVDTNFLWEIISKKFPDNRITKRQIEDKNRELEKESAIRRFESLGCPDQKT